MKILKPLSFTLIIYLSCNEGADVKSKQDQIKLPDISTLTVRNPVLNTAPTTEVQRQKVSTVVVEQVDDLIKAGKK